MDYASITRTLHPAEIAVGAPLGRYSFISKSYVHGIMHGGCFKGKNFAEWEAIELE